MPPLIRPIIAVLLAFASTGCFGSLHDQVKADLDAREKRMNEKADAKMQLIASKTQADAIIARQDLESKHSREVLKAQTAFFKTLVKKVEKNEEEREKLQQQLKELETISARQQEEIDALNKKQHKTASAQDSKSPKPEEKPAAEARPAEPPAQVEERRKKLKASFDEMCGKYDGVQLLVLLGQRRKYTKKECMTKWDDELQAAFKDKNSERAHDKLKARRTIFCYTVDKAKTSSGAELTKDECFDETKKILETAFN